MVEKKDEKTIVVEKSIANADVDIDVSKEAKKPKSAEIKRDPIIILKW